MTSTVQQIQDVARELLAEKTVDVFIGFEKGTIPFKSRPSFATKPEEAESLLWDSFCSNNLAVFLPTYFENQPNRRRPREKPFPKIGMTVKGCDFRSVVALTKERQAVRENLVIVGVPCEGMVDRRRLVALLGTEEIASYSEADGNIHVTTRAGETRVVPKTDVMRQACVECRFPTPEGADRLLEGSAKESGDGGYARIAEFEKKSVDERWAYFEQELSKCIRCNACRQACPTCWCRECFAEQTDMKWIGVGNTLSDAMVFQIIRVYHQAGRCVECDACYDACPMGIDLRTYTKKIVKDVDESFGFVPDFDTESTPPLSTFSEQDSDSFITDPEKH